MDRLSLAGFLATKRFKNANLQETITSIFRRRKQKYAKVSSRRHDSGARCCCVRKKTGGRRACPRTRTRSCSRAKAC
jgi:hypothetical protein